MKKWTFLLVAILVTLSLLLSGCAKKEYSLTIAVSGEGTTVPATGTYTYQDGQSVTISATPASGWKFDGWSGDVTGSNITVSIRMDGNKSLTANFSKITYILTMSVNGTGTTNPTAGARIYDAGTVVNITANPGTGWNFDSWSGGVAAPSSASMTVTMDSDKMVTANFSRLSYLTMSVNGNGTTNPSSGTYTYAAGQVVNISAYPSSGWKFDSWSGGVAAPSSASTTVTMDSNKSLVANFKQVLSWTVSNHVINGGYWTELPSNGVYVQAGRTLNLSWSADSNLTCFIFTVTQYNNFKPLGIVSAYMARGSGSQGSITATIQNCDTYYAIIYNNTTAFGPSIKLYQAVLTEQ
jgi:uncharacterized repeat protein (TIGR02543 family)